MNGELLKSAIELLKEIARDEHTGFEDSVCFEFLADNDIGVDDEPLETE